MQTITLYRYTRPDGGVTNATVKPDEEYTIRYRLIADEGMALTNGTDTAACVDVDSPEGWTEIAEPGEQSEIETYKAALNELGVDTEEVSDNAE